MFESYTKQLLCHLESIGKECPPTVVTRIFDFYRPKSRPPNLQKLLNEVFIPLLKVVDEVTLFVDGVEECEEQEVRDIIKHLKKLLDTSSCQIFISCREEIDISQRIPSAINIRITPEDTKEDMERFIDNLIEDMQSGRPISDNQSTLEYIKQELRKNAHRM